MRVLVTGHKGYIGTVLTPMLRARGHQVVGMDSDLYSGANYGPAPAREVELLKDIRDAEHKDFDGIDAVIHLAGLSNDPLGDLDPELTYELNEEASIRLAELARESGVTRFLFSSSCSTYGAGGSDMLDESAPFNPVTPYGETKVNVERRLSEMAGRDFSPVYLRNATAYGVSPRLRFDLVLNNLVAWAVTSGRVFIKSDGSPWRPIVHIEDISRAFVAALEADRDLVHDEAFNVGRTDENFQIREIADMVGEIVPDCVVEYAEGAGPDARTYRVNCDKIRRVLPAFVPQWTTRKGIVELLKAYRMFGLTLEEFEGPRYQRLAYIKDLIANAHLDSSLRWTSRAKTEQVPA